MKHFKTKMSFMLFILIVINLKENQGIDSKCRERNRLIESNNSDLYTLIDATLGEKVILQCHYCKENDDGRPKIWYKVDNFASSSPHEVELGMNNDPDRNTIIVNSRHDLIIRNFSSRGDTGLYYCKRLGEDLEEEKFHYLIDLVWKENVSDFETGDLVQWKKYDEEYFTPINALFSTSQGSEFKYIRERLNLEMILVTRWQSWGICEVCGHPKNESTRRKIGLCRIKLTHKGHNFTEKELSDPDFSFLMNANMIACRSEILSRKLPELSNRTQVIPNFILIERCEGTCNPDAEGLGKGWKTGKTLGFKYRKTYVLAENAHLTLICPESTMDNAVVWKKNGKPLKRGANFAKPDEEPRIMIDTFNTLYLFDVQQSEEGNYTCEVDKIRMQQIKIFIVSKSRLLTQAFVRHMIYLGLILSLTTSCYCGGLVIAWTRRRKFKNYEELKEIEEDRRKGRFGALV